MAFRSIRPGRRWRGTTFLALFLVLAAFSASCASSGYLYVSSSDRNAYFKVPADWKYFDKRDLLVATGQSLSAESNRQLAWLIGYDADPRPSIDHIIQLSEVPDYPVVEARVQQLPFNVRDQLSLQSLRNWVYPVDRMVRENLGDVLSYQDVTLPGGLHGIRMNFEAAPAGLDAVVAENDLMWVTQEILVDPATQKLYQFMIRTNAHYYRANKALVDQIIDSWTVKER
jgi:hypothetical protein